MMKKEEKKKKEKKRIGLPDNIFAGFAFS